MNERVIDHLPGDGSGPLVVCIGGLHGNEPMSLRAMRKLISEIRRLGLSIHGELLCLVGNRQALAAGQRYMRWDLNRLWTRSQMRRIASRQAEGQALEAEELELEELRTLLARLFTENAGRDIYFIDLHTTSSDSVPFCILGDTLENRKLALSFPVPIILGLEEQIDGSLMEYVSRSGAITCSFEGGRHDSERAVEYHLALLWLALEATGLIEARRIPEIHRHRRLLQKATMELPRVCEVRYRHPVGALSQFKMRPGFASFDPIRAGDLLAWDDQGEIRSPRGGRLLMPLYQNQGGDGFFLVRPISPVWLTISRWLRRSGLRKYLHRLPGVYRTGRADRLLVNPNVARHFPVEILHLLGYRKKRRRGPFLTFDARRDRTPVN